MLSILCWEILEDRGTYVEIWLHFVLGLEFCFFLEVPLYFHYTELSWKAATKGYSFPLKTSQPRNKIPSVFLFERQKECEHELAGGTGQREREKENFKQAPRSVQSMLGAWSQDLEIMAWAEIKSWTLNQLCHSGIPSPSVFLFAFLSW